MPHIPEIGVESLNYVSIPDTQKHMHGWVHVHIESAPTLSVSSLYKNIDAVTQ